MTSIFILLLLLAVTGVCIWVLHRNQQRRTVEAADLNAPLPALDDNRLPDFEPAATGTMTNPGAETWHAQVRTLRDQGRLDAALALSREQFPRTHAFQQAAIILRQQIKIALDGFHPADALLRELYHTAALADLFRTSSSHKAVDPSAALAALRTHTFHYADLGHSRLRLLNKSDVRALEQLWGPPPTHRHTEDVLGEQWLQWCRPPAA